MASNAVAFAGRDAYPVSRGHTLVVTRWVVPDWFSATADERLGILHLLDEVKCQLDDELHPDGYNVGFNAGLAAGQTAMHLHCTLSGATAATCTTRRAASGTSSRARATPPRREAARDRRDRASQIAIVAAFVPEPGLRRIEAATRDALLVVGQVEHVEHLARCPPLATPLMPHDRNDQRQSLRAWMITQVRVPQHHRVLQQPKGHQPVAARLVLEQQQQSRIAPGDLRAEHQVRVKRVQRFVGRGSRDGARAS